MAFNITLSPSNTEILARLLGDTTGLSNIQIATTGNPLAVGLFQDSPLNLSSGVVLGTGQVSQLVGQNTTDQNNITTDFGLPGTVDKGQDAIKIEITFDADKIDRQLFFQYVFGSEEFLDYSGNIFNDIFTFELNGVNLAKLNNGNTASINSLTPSQDPSFFSPEFISNLSLPFTLTTLDGYTVPLTFTGAVIPDANNRLVITIQDIGDANVDSAVFLAGGTLGVTRPLPIITLAVDSTIGIYEDGRGALLYTFTRSGAIDQELNVNFQIDGTATLNQDYSTDQQFANGASNTNTINFAVGSNTANIFVRPLADNLVEGDETVSLSLLPALAAQYIVGNTGAVTSKILDQDTVLNNVSLSLINNNVIEDGLDTLLYTFTRTGPTDEPLKVDFDISGTASTSDYNVNGFNTLSSNGINYLSGSFLFNTGNDTATIEVVPIADTIAELDETVLFTLAPIRFDSIPGGNFRTYGINTPDAITGTIVQPLIPTAPTIEVFNNSFNVAEDSTFTLDYIFTRSGAAVGALTVAFSLGGVATRNVDYSVISGTNGNVNFVTFQDGEKQAIVNIKPIVDTLVEGTETVDLTINEGKDYLIGQSSSASGEITDPVAAFTPANITLALSQIAVDESGADSLVYTLTRTGGDLTQPLSITYQLAGTATLGADYTASGKPIVRTDFRLIDFAAGASTTTVVIDPTPDTLVEGNETVNFSLVPNAIGSGYGQSGQYLFDPSMGSLIGTIAEAAINLFPTISLVVEPLSVNEGSRSSLNFIFSRTGSTSDPLTVNFSVEGTATSADYTQTGATDFTATAGTITFLANSSTATITFAPTADTIIESAETIALNLVPNSNYMIGVNSSTVGTIVDQPAPNVSLAINQASVNEDGLANLIYTFTRNGSTQNPLTVTYRVDGTANPNNDYTLGASPVAATATVTFSVGADTANIFVDPTPDTLVEADETVSITLVSAGNAQYAISNSAAVTGTILDQDTALNSISLAVAPNQVTEDGTANLVYTFTRTGLTTEALRVDYDFGGNAAFGTDYLVTGANSLGSVSSASGTVTLNIGTVNFAAGVDTARVIVDPTADAIAETNENVTLRLVSSRNDPVTGGGRSYNISTPDATVGTIIEPIIEIPQISVVLEPASTNEDGSTANLVYVFNRTGSTAASLTATYNIGGTATFNADYTQSGATDFTATNGTITFAANSATATLAITPANDAITETDETVILTLAGNSTYTIGSSSSAAGTIVDVPPVVVVTPPVVSLAVNPASVNEDGTANLVYTFTRTGSTGNSLTATYSVDGTANSSNDYTLNSAFVGATATVTFSIGSNTATVFVNPSPDNLVEADETVTLTLIPAGNGQYTVGSNAAITGTILDQDTALNSISLAVSPNQVTEDGTANLVYTFTRTGSTTEALRVDYDFGGNAAFGTDYIVTGADSLGSVSSASGTVAFNVGTVNFAVGADTATVIVDPTADSISETNESVTLRLVASRNDPLTGGGRSYNISTPGTLTGTITEPVVTVTNLPPIAIAFNGSVTNNRFLIAENTNTTTPIKLTDIAITDDQLGVNTLNLSGTDANSFELIGTALFLRSGIALDFETRTTYNLVVTVDDVTVGSTPDVASNFTLIVTDINEPPTGAPIVPIGNTAQNTPIRIPRSAFLTGFTDIENDLLNVVNPVASNGIIVNNNDGTFTLTPTANFSGQINIAYGVTDGVNFLTGQLRSVVVLPPENGLNFIGTNNLDIGAVNSFTNGIFAVNPNNINLVGDEINLVGGANSVTVPGKNITLQPDRLNQAIQIGSTDSNRADILDLTPTDLAAIADGFSKIIIGRANGTGNIDISSNVTFRDPILLQSPGGQLNISAPITLTDNATLDFSVRALVKSGSSTLTLNGNTPTTFIGNTTINGGILLLAKAPNTAALNDAPISVNSGTLQLGNNGQINNAADLTLNGGSFSLNGFNETLDRLQVTSNSTINLGNGSSKLAFGNSSTANWTGLLSIENWSSTSGETVRFGNNADGLTAAQLNNIQFVGFSRGANISASGFITPVGIIVVSPTPDQDGVNDDIEDLAPNDGDGNFDGIRDSLQENVVSILNLGGAGSNSIVTVIAQTGAKISGLRSLANPITIANLTSLANPIEFKVSGLTSGATTTVEYLIAKADQNRQYNTYLMFGSTADNLTPHAYEFLYDGRTGAELFDTNGDGLTDKAVVHFVDGLRGDSDLIANGEIQDPGAPGVANTPVGLSTDANAVQITGAGIAIASFSLVANQTKQVSEVGFFKIDGANAVRGIATNAAGFARTALQSGQVIFSSLADNLLSTADISRQLQLSAGDRLGFYLVQNGTVDAALQRNDFSNVVFSLDQANPAAKKALEVTTESNGSYRLKWEQGNAELNDDLILNLQLQNAPLNNQNLVASVQGDRESELLDLSSFTGRDVQVTFTIKREAAFNNTVGFYQIEDAQGTVISITGAKIKPGEAGYQAAVVQNRIAGVDLAVANGQTASIDAVLRGGAIYAPFLIANANPDTLNGNFSNVYTSYTVGNADTTDHVRLLGDNTFGFEDLVGGGDKDFNDVVIKAVFKNS
jgi:autotransporter-associated beta strand protein